MRFVNQKILDWLRVFRAHTAPATVCLVLAGYLWQIQPDFTALIVALFAIISHWLGYGHNSLMDAAMGYDLRDPNKKHFPLVAGRIELRKAHIVIHYGMLAMIILAAAASLEGANPAMSLLGLVLWIAGGQAYDDGLSKESKYGFIPIAVCWTGAVMWAYFLSHREIVSGAEALFLYVFVLTVYQIGWCGHMKEMEVGERSNILVRLGARVEDGVFRPGFSAAFAVFVKFLQVLLMYALVDGREWWKTAWFAGNLIFQAYVTYIHVKPKRWERMKIIRDLVKEQIASIFYPLPLAMGVWALPLMAFSISYFIVFNKKLWGTDLAPRV